MKPARLLRFTVFALASGFSATITAAQGQSGDLRNLSGMALMNGTCQRLIVAGRDLTKACLGKVTNSMYESTGRTGFSFVTSDNSAVTFSGMDTPAKGNRAASILDHVIFTPKNSEADPTKVKPNVVPARGTCTYTNPYAGPSHINCTASTSMGSFSASFVSDGKAPTIERF